MEARELCQRIATIIDEKNGRDIVILNLQGISPITDYFVIATGNNNRAVDAIVDEIENVLRPEGIHAFAIEGRESDNTWDLMDFGDVMVHVFQPEAREFYRLEKLWGNCERIEYVEGEFKVIGAPAKAEEGASSDVAGEE